MVFHQLEINPWLVVDFWNATSSVIVLSSAPGQSILQAAIHVEGTLRLVKSRSRWIFSCKSRGLIRSRVIFAEITQRSHCVLTHSFRCTRNRRLCDRIGRSDGL